MRHIRSPAIISRADRTHRRRMRKAETWYRKRADRNGERAMAHTLDEICADSRVALKAAPLGDALPQIAERLARLLSNPDFVAATFSDDMPPGRRVLHHDPATAFYVLAHVQEGKKNGQPHSHGSRRAGDR